MYSRPFPVHRLSPSKFSKNTWFSHFLLFHLHVISSRLPCWFLWFDKLEEYSVHCEMQSDFRSVYSRWLSIHKLYPCNSCPILWSSICFHFKTWISPRRSHCCKFNDSFRVTPTSLADVKTGQKTTIHPLKEHYSIYQFTTAAFHQQIDFVDPLF